MRPRRRLSCALILFLASLGVLPIVLAGCGAKNSDECYVQGLVTFNGQAVPSGSIVFEPDASQGNRGPSGFATITDGQYDTRHGGKGVRPGAVQVIVSGFDGHGANSDSGQGRALFPTYTMKAQVSTQTPTLDVNVPGNGR